MRGKDERSRCVERVWEGTRSELESLAQAYEQLEPSVDGLVSPRGRRRPSAAALFARASLSQGTHGGELCPQ